MPFEKGRKKTGGRQKGTPNANPFRGMIESEIPDLIKKVVEEAKSGNMQAIKICMDRIFPLPRAREETIPIEGIDVESLIDQSKVIFNKLANGELSPSEANALLSTIASKAKLVETEEIIKRLEELEHQVLGHRNAA